MKIKIITSCLTAFLYLSSCQSEKSIPSQNIKSSVFVDSVENVLNQQIPKWQKEYHVPCVGIGLIENGEVRLIKVYGEHQSGKIAPKNTIFNVASITKAVVTMATLKLVQMGEWNLDEPLYHYWVDPDIKHDSLHKKLTTRHILGHTTGFKNWRRMNPDEKLSFDFEPGSQYQYSGEGFEYLATALEKKFNKKFDALIDSLIFEPVQMQDATLSWLSDQDTVRFAHWYDGNGQPHKESHKTHWVSAADDLLVTVQDLVNFGIATMDNTLISPTLFTQMTSPQVKIHNNANQGLGWTIVNDLPNEEYLIDHDGGDMGVATSLLLLPKSKNGLVVFTNADNGRILCNKIIRASFSFGDEIVKKLYWGEEVPEIVTIDNTLLEQYEGVYETNLGRTIQFQKLDNSLKLLGTGIPQWSIYPENENTFFPLDFEIHFTFKRDSTGNVNSFELSHGGKVTLTGKKQ